MNRLSCSTSGHLLSLIILCVGATCAQSNKISGVLSLDQAVQFAVDHHPGVQIGNAIVNLASSSVTQNASTYYPQISAVGSFTRNDGTFVFNTPGFPIRSQTYNNLTGALQVTQTIFDFGKTINRVSATNRLYDAALSSLDSTRESVIMNVKIAFYDFMQQQQVVNVNQEAVDQTSQHLAESKAFYAVGKRAQLDVTKAEVDYANAQVGLIVATNQLKLARLQLNNAMGVRASTDYSVIDTFTVQPMTMSLDSAKSVMESTRPELLAARARVEASKALVNASWDQNLPTISASGTYTWSNFDFPLYSHWGAGVTVSLPIFQGFSIAAQTDQARASENASEAALDLEDQTLELEIEQNYLGVKEAEERIAATSKLVEQAEESMVLAERQYVAGVGSALDVTDARLSLSNARITRIQALADYNTFLVRLQRSMGILAQ